LLLLVSAAFAYAEQQNKNEETVITNSAVLNGSTMVEFSAPMQSVKLKQLRRNIKKCV